MKSLSTNLNLKKMITPLVFFFFFFALTVNANAQVISANGIKAPAIVTAHGSLNPDVFIGTTVVVKETGGSKCDKVTYEWQSATNPSFTENLKKNLATTKDYDPDTITTTTYFRRIASVVCNDPERSASSICTGVTITIL